MDEKTINELSGFFEKADLPKLVEFEPGITITDLPKFIDSHFYIVKSGNKMMGEIFLQRLVKLKKILST